MIRVEAPTLQEAYSKAAAELSCSVVNLDITIIQNGSSGFLGMFKKSAIIEAQRKGTPKASKQEEKEKPKEENLSRASNVSEGFPERDKNRRNKNRKNRSKQKETFKNEEHIAHKKSVESQPVAERVVQKELKTAESEKVTQKPREMHYKVASTPVEQTFHPEKKEISLVIDEVRAQVEHLFQYSCFSLNKPLVSVYDAETILIEFSGEDAALLIGKEGYRYKALSYLLYNWINLKHGLNIRLEIAEFLKNQEEMIQKYLIPVIERIRTNGRGQTKILDGVLIKIALEALRQAFPEKYVGIKTGREGGKFVVVNDFNRKNT